jgi:hypothetical protein
MASKTIKVELLVEQLNKTLRTYVEKSTNLDGIEGQRVFLENILMSTGNYKGFFYLTEDEVPEGERPGIRNESTANRFIDTDCNRVKYI